MEQIQTLIHNRRLQLLTLALVCVLAAGLSGLVYPSNFSPLFVLVGCAGVVAVCVYFWKPEFALYTALVVVLLPSGLIPQTYQSLLNRALTLLAFGIWCFDLIFRRRRVVFTLSTTLMAAFLLWSGISVLWAENTGAALTDIQMYLMRFLLFLILIPNQIDTRAKLDGLLKALALVGWILVISSAVAVIQQGYTFGTRFKLLDENENALGTLALVASLGVLWVSARGPRRKQLPVSVVTFFYMISMVGLVAVSGSRGSLLSLVIALLAFAGWRSTRTWARLSLAIGLVILIVAPNIFLTTFERFTESSSDNLAVLGGRAALWQAAWQVIVDHPLLGVGVGGSSYAVLSHLWMVSAAVGKDSVAIHNPILTIWSELGIPGILLYLGILASAAWSFMGQYYRYRKADLHGRFIPYFPLVASILLGYLASWVKGGGAEGDRLFFLLIGLLLVPAILDIGETIEDRRGGEAGAGL